MIFLASFLSQQGCATKSIFMVSPKRFSHEYIYFLKLKGTPPNASYFSWKKREQIELFSIVLFIGFFP